MRTDHADTGEDVSASRVVRAKRVGWIYLAIAISGLSALGAEVVWTRLLSLLLGGTVYTFSIILAVFLCGLWFGSSAGAFAARRSSYPVVALAGCQIGLILWIGWGRAQHPSRLDGPVLVLHVRPQGALENA